MDISDILSSLSAEDMQALQSIASSLTGKSDTPVNATADPTKAVTKNVQNNQNGEPLGIDPKAFSDMAGLMSKLNSTGNDPRCQLINALKPMLSKERQQRADEAMRIIKLLDLLPMLRDSGLLKGVLGQ